MVVMIRTVLVTLCGAILAAAAMAQETIPVPKKPTSYVTDRPNVIGPKTQPALEAKLEKFGKETGNQVVVWIGSTLPEGVTIEEYANASFNLWGLGQKEKDNGVLLMLFIQSRKMRIETGDGVRDRLTDARAAEIIAAMREPLRANEYNRAVTEATDSIMAALTPPPAPAPQPLQTPEEPSAPPRPISGGDLAVVIPTCLAGAACIGAVLIACFYILRAIVRGLSQGVTFGGGGIGSDNNVTVTHNHYRRGWGWGGWGSSSRQPTNTTIVNRIVDTRSRSSSSSSDDDGGSSRSSGSGGGFSGGGSSSGGGASGSW